MLDREEFSWPGFVPDSLPDCVRFAPTGGATITAARLREVREGLVEVTGRHGFPKQASREGSASFDAELAGWMASLAELGTGEALRDDEHFAYVAAWEYTGRDTEPRLHQEPLDFEYVHLAQRSYK